MGTTEVKGNKLLLLIGTAWLFDALDVALLSFIMPAIKTSWHLSASTLGVVSSVTSLGMFFGAIIFGHLADKIGRKPIMLVTLLLFSGGNILLALTPNVELFILVRFITGLGLGGELPVATTIIADHFKGKERSRMLVLVDSFWAFGWILAAVLAFSVMTYIGWRVTVLITALMGLYVILIRRHLPETHTAEAAKYSFKEAWTQVWSSQYWRTTLALGILWFVIMFVYYGMFLWLPTVLATRGFPLVKSYGYTVLMSLAQLPGYYLAAWLVGRVSRKLVLSIYLLGTMASAAVFGLATSNTMILVSGAWLSFFTLGAWGIMIAFTPSHYSLAVRGMGIGVTQSIGRVGAIGGPYLVGMLISIGFSIPAVFGVFVGALVLGILVLLFGLKDHVDRD
ncbi:MFS transporter [Lactiplantibacillus songbeiensis]|uniref:MFS transporter n=1 Tax=Lactiplantibacillus songbeiensis TaxID=2559920 RepID=A0ABW4BVZ8_9LACO|nr:MFS transporter [Lactiplantibacillus songbeiensis]